MSSAAIGPRHLAQLGAAELRATDVAPTVAIVAGIEELAPLLDLIERHPEHFFWSATGLLNEERG
jgi:hypothetical protein